ncbi:response regulator [bacterium]|nr:response regulator [bacterium]
MENYSILIAEDDSEYLQSCENILQLNADGFIIDTAMRSDECVGKVFRNSYDVLLLNYQLTGEPLIETLNRIKTIKPQLPIILLVNEGHEDEAEMALSHGVDDFVTKVEGDQTALPFTIRKVIERNQLRVNAAKSPTIDKTTAEPDTVPSIPVTPDSSEITLVPENTAEPVTDVHGDAFFQFDKSFGDLAVEKKETPAAHTRPVFASSEEHPRFTLVDDAEATDDNTPIVPISQETPPRKTKNNGPELSGARQPDDFHVADDEEEFPEIELTPPTGIPSWKPVATEKKANTIPKPLKTPKPAAQIIYPERYILDRKGHFLAVNQHIIDITEYSENELLELNFTDLLPIEKGMQFIKWFSQLNLNGNEAKLLVELLTKHGESCSTSIELSALRNGKGNIVQFQGDITPAPEMRHDFELSDTDLNELQLINDLVDAIQSNLHKPIVQLLERLTQIASEFFKFRKVTLGLLDRKKRVFVKQAMIGQKKLKSDTRLLEVPESVISQIFQQNTKTRVVYYNKNGLVDLESEQARQFLHDEPDQSAILQLEWSHEDMLLLNLTDQHQRTFGYVSLELPLTSESIRSNIIKNMQVFARMAALAIENRYHISQIERRHHRLKQLLAAGNIFRLHFNINELMRELVWAIKFSLDFNFAGLALVSSRSGKLEFRSVACDNKLKLIQIEELQFSLTEISKLITDENKRSKSYFITQPEDTFQNLKTIYYGHRLKEKTPGATWEKSFLLLIPVKTRDRKIAGFILVDDPQDQRIPSRDVLRTLEILANQISVAIDNRTMYHQLKKRLKKMEEESQLFKSPSEYSHSAGMDRLVNRYLR